MNHDIENPATGEPGYVAGSPRSWSYGTQQQEGISIGAPGPQEIAFDGIDLVRDLIDWSLKSAPKPMHEASLVFALMVVGGIAQRAFNIDGTSLNNYYILLSGTGTGKGIVKSCWSKLTTEVAKAGAPVIQELLSPGSYASGQAIIKTLAEKRVPQVVSIIDEWGHEQAEMANPRNTNAKVKEKVFLEMWSLGNKDSFFDPLAYSDKDKSTKAIPSPNFTMVGLSTADVFNEAIGNKQASNGLLARFIMVENGNPIPRYNQQHKDNLQCIPAHIVSNVGCLVQRSLALTTKGQCCDIPIDDEATRHFNAYSDELDDRMNAVAEGPSRWLWNRGREKAVKLAGILAVGQNWNFPVVTMKEAQWATSFIDQQTLKQVTKFANGDVGIQTGNQNKQHDEVKRVVREYFEAPFERYSKYGNLWEMHRDGIVTEAYIQRRLITLTAFQDPRVGATNAIKNVIKEFLSQDEMREIPKSQMQQSYGLGPRAFCLVRPKEFFGVGKGKI
jgi:Protein of unknown function (DUF3987)